MKYKDKGRTVMKGHGLGVELATLQDLKEIAGVRVWTL